MASNQSLTVVKNRGWLQGYGNLVNKENHGWWHTWQWLIQIAIWAAIVNGMLVLVMIVAPQADAAQAAARREQAGVPPQDLLATGLTVFFTFLALAPAVGVVIIGQDAVIQERQTGTVAWVLSKPVSRVAFLLSKLTSDGLGILVTMVLVQGAIAYGSFLISTGNALNIAGYLGGLGIVYVYLIFFLTLTLMLGTLFKKRGAVIGIPMFLIFGYQIVLGLLPQIGPYSPYPLVISNDPNSPAVAAALVSGVPISSWSPLIASLLWIVMFVGVAIWRFDKEEF